MATPAPGTNAQHPPFGCGHLLLILVVLCFMFFAPEKGKEEFMED